MALETERSSPSGASSPGPNRDVHHPHRPTSPSSATSSSTTAPTSIISSGGNDTSSPSPANTASMGMPTSSPPLTKFEPETAHGDTGGGELPPPPPPASTMISPCDALPFTHAPVYIPRLHHPHPSPTSSVSPCSPSASSSSSYYAGSPPLSIYQLHHPHAQPPPPPIGYHHHPHHPTAHHLTVSPFAPPTTSIVAPQAILAAGMALGGLALGTEPASSCGWADLSPPPLHPQPGLLSHPHHPLLRLRPEEILSRPRHPPAPQQQLPQPPPSPSLPFSVDNILRPAFGLRAVLEEEERGRRRLLGKESGRSAAPLQTQSLPTLPQLPPKTTAHKKKKPEVVPSTPKDVDNPSGGQVERTPAKVAEGSKAEEDESKSTESKLPNPASSNNDSMLWPAWVYCTRYSDRPSSGPRSRRVKRKERSKGESSSGEEKRPRTAFSAEQLSRLKQEFAESRYLTEKRRQALARDLRLNESQIKIWFQNKRAKIKKASGQKGGLALQLMAQGLYNHSTIPVDEDEEEEAAAAAFAAAEEEKRRQAGASMVIPSVVVGGGGGAVPLDTRPPALLVER